MVLAAAFPSAPWFVELQFEESAFPELTQMGNPESARHWDGAGTADSGLNKGFWAIPHQGMDGGHRESLGVTAILHVSPGWPVTVSAGVGGMGGAKARRRASPVLLAQH